MMEDPLQVRRFANSCGMMIIAAMGGRPTPDDVLDEIVNALDLPQDRKRMIMALHGHRLIDDGQAAEQMDKHQLAGV